MTRKQKEEISVVVFPQIQILENQFTWLTYYVNISDGSPTFRCVDSTIYAIKKLKAIAEIFNSDGTYNGKNKRAERYAICLAYEGKKEEALKLFLAVVGTSEEVLFVNEKTENEKEIFPSVANMPGKLGYEGAFVCASLCLEDSKMRKLGIKILCEMAEKLSVNCNIWRLKQIFVFALKMLLENGIEQIGNIDVAQKLEIIVETQY